MEWSNIAQHIPFIAAMTDRRLGKPLLTGLLEKAITAVLAAGIAIYTNDIRQDSKLEQERQSMQEMREMLSQMQSDIRQMRSDLYMPRNR